MPLPVVWSEREYPHYRDCVFSAWLDVLVFAGFTNYPLGIYTNAEREAFERAGSHIAETATTMAQASENSTNRYNLDLHPLDVSLSSALTRIGTGIILFGRNGNLPSGDSWRRWDPSFSGIHAVSVFPLGNGKSRVLDPEAPMGFQGDEVSNTKILKWASGVGDARYARENEFQSTFLGFHITVHKGVYTVYHPERYTHALKEKRTVTFSRTSGAPVWHGVPGFWEVAKGGLYSWYFVNGHSGLAFETEKVYRLGNGKIIYQPVSPGS